jgi:hypothetical protein
MEISIIARPGLDQDLVASNLEKLLRETMVYSFLSSYGENSLPCVILGASGCDGSYRKVRVARFGGVNLPEPHY